MPKYTSNIELLLLKFGLSTNGTPSTSEWTPSVPFVLSGAGGFGAGRVAGDAIL